MKILLRYLASALALLVLAGMLAGFGGALLFPLDALAHFRFHLLIAALPVAILALLVANWTAVMRVGVAAFLALAGLAPLWEAAPIPAEGRTITVMTANLNNDNPSPEFVRAALFAQDVDILVTQETTKTMQEGETSLAQQYPHRLQLSTSGQILRTVLWSKFPMRDGQLMLEDAVEPTGAMAVLDLGEGAELLVVGLHLAHAATGNQGDQIDALTGLLATRPFPRLVLGDLNATPWSWGVSRLQQVTGTERVPGYRVTWRGGYPSPFGTIPSVIGQPIDHILVSPEIEPGEIKTIELPGSDHLGLRATLRIP